MIVKRMVGQTKFIKDGLKGLLTLADGGVIAASGEHQYVINAEYSGVGYLYADKDNPVQRKKIFDRLFEGNLPFTCGTKEIYRKPEYLQFTIKGTTGHLAIHDDKKISLTEEYKYLLDSINKEIFSYNENDNTCYISKPKVKTTTIVLDRFFDYEKYKDTVKNSTTVNEIFESDIHKDSIKRNSKIGKILPSCKELMKIAKSIREKTGSSQPQPEDIFAIWEQSHNQVLDDQMQKQLIQECFRRK